MLSHSAYEMSLTGLKCWPAVNLVIPDRLGKCAQSQILILIAISSSPCQGTSRLASMKNRCFRYRFMQMQRDRLPKN
jgi:hypothetical protein